MLVAAHCDPFFTCNLPARLEAAPRTPYVVDDYDMSIIEFNAEIKVKRTVYVEGMRKSRGPVARVMKRRTETGCMH